MSVSTEARVWFPLLLVQERLTELLQVPNFLFNLMHSSEIQLVCQVFGALAEQGVPLERSLSEVSSNCYFFLLLSSMGWHIFVEIESHLNLIAFRGQKIQQ